jgi:molecular chaperone DnaK
VLEQAGITWANIDKVLLVGGSTRMPMVQALVRRLSDKTPEPGVNPDEAVALGAAILAAQVSAERGDGAVTLPHPISISDVTSQALGEILLDSDTGRQVNTIIIPRNTPIPCKKELISFTMYENQPKIDVWVTEGEDDDPQYVAVLHKTQMTLPRGLPKHSPIRTIMAYDLDGVVHVELFDLTNNMSLGEIELDRPNNLSAVELARSKVALRTLGLQ